MIPLYNGLDIINVNANQVMTQLMLYVTLPALILFSFNIEFKWRLISSLATLMMMSLFILAVSIVIGMILRRKSHLPRHQESVYESLIIFGNQGFIGFAVSYILMGNQGIIYLTFFNICYLVLIWTYGIYLFTKKQHEMNWMSLFFNPGILATLLGLILMFAPFQWPSILHETLESVGKMTIPLSTILIGSMLAEVSWDEFRWHIKSSHIWIAAAWKLLLLPVCLFIFIFLSIPYPILVIAILTSAMPSAPTTTVYAQKFGGDPAFASFGVILSTMLCAITIPLLYLFFNYFYAVFHSS